MNRISCFILALNLGIFYIAAKSIDVDTKDQDINLKKPECGLSQHMAWTECSSCPTTCTTPDNCMFPYCDSQRMCQCQKVWCKDDMMCHFFRIPCSGNFTCRDNSCICEGYRNGQHVL